MKSKGYYEIKKMNRLIPDLNVEAFCRKRKDLTVCIGTSIWRSSAASPEVSRSGSTAHF